MASHLKGIVLMTSNERIREIREALAVLVEEAKTLNSYESARGRLIQKVYGGLREEIQALLYASPYPDCEVTYDNL
jgi:hypothetical protein